MRACTELGCSCLLERVALFWAAEGRAPGGEGDKHGNCLRAWGRERKGGGLQRGVGKKMPGELIKKTYVCLNTDSLGLNALRADFCSSNSVKHLLFLWPVAVRHLILVLHVKLLGNIYQPSHMNLIH